MLVFHFEIKFINIQSGWINLKPVSRVIYNTKLLLLHKKGFLVLFSIPLTDSIRFLKQTKKNNHFSMRKCFQLVVSFRYCCFALYNRISTTFSNTSRLIYTIYIYHFSAQSILKLKIDPLIMMMLMNNTRGWRKTRLFPWCFIFMLTNSIPGSSRFTPEGSLKSSFS